MLVKSQNLKGYIKLGAFLGLGYIIYKVVRQQIIKKNVLASFGDIKTLTDNKKGNKGGFSLPKNEPQNKFDAHYPAKALHDAMNGLMTDENKIWDTLDPLTQKEREEVRKHFNTYFGDKESLQQWFRDDLSGKELSKALSYFN